MTPLKRLPNFHHETIASPEANLQVVMLNETTLGGNDRRRLTKAERAKLEAEFAKDNNWSREKQAKIGASIGVGRIKVYKWLYDRKQRFMAEVGATMFESKIRGVI